MGADREAHLERALGGELLEQVHNSKILCVGAGGIGCELLKNLVLTGFRNIEVIDLDTIDVSNLNRQFLFRSRHVGMSKSLIAQKAATAFNPAATIKSHLGNVKSEEFGINYFEKFDLVLNALDNVNARQHVNRLCLAANIPLIDSGTTGYLGQTTVIKKGETPCYDCDPKSDNKKTFPICTIRNTPDKPVHCIVWAKELFKLLFGRQDESMLSGIDESDFGPENGATEKQEDDSKDDGAADKAQREEMQQKEIEARTLIISAATRPSAEVYNDEAQLRSYARGVFDAVFDQEIKLKLRMRDGYKGAKKVPTPLPWIEASNATEENAGKSQQASIHDQRVLPINECAQLFEDTVVRMWSPEHRETIGDAEFDKDNDLSLDFVTAAANLRSQVFGIERKSKFDVKGIAGNIIHAIATTNAIVAGLQVIEAIKILSKLKKTPLPAPYGVKSTTDDVTEHSKSVWVVREPIGSGFLLQASKLDKPNPKCYSCGSAMLDLHIDTEKATLDTLVNTVLKGQLGVNNPALMLASDEIYNEGEGLDDDEIEFFKLNLPKTLENCPAGGIKDGTIIDVGDFSQEMSFKMVVRHRPNESFSQEGNAKLFEIGGDKPVASAPSADGVAPEAAPSDAPVAPGNVNNKNDDDDVVQLVEPNQKKRDRDASTCCKGNSQKKPCKQVSSSVVELDD